MGEGARYFIALTTSDDEMILLRVAGLLWRKRAAVVHLSMRSHEAGRRFEIALNVSRERVQRIGLELQKLIDVYDVVVGQLAGTAERATAGDSRPLEEAFIRILGEEPGLAGGRDPTPAAGPAFLRSQGRAGRPGR